MQIYNQSRLINLLKFALFVLVIGFLSCNEKQPADINKPNILLIFTDQQNSYAMSAAGNINLNTPAMDLLANQGIMFKQAYCTSPVCGPARSSIVSGKMPHQTGVEWNGQSMHENVITSGEILRENGYKTVWGGKWHLPESYPQRKAAKNKEIKGFDVLPFWNPEEPRWFLGAETDPPLTESVVDFLNKYDEEKPFFLAVSYHNPHDICMYARKDGWVTEEDSLLEIRHYGFKYKLPDVMGEYPGNIKNLPPLPFNHPIEKNEPEFITDKRKYHNEYGLETKLANAEFTELEWKGYLNAYYRLTEMVDTEIGKVLTALKENGLDGNTLIIFTSDHGDGATAHKWAAKLSFYEESAKIPLIISYPGRIPSGTVNQKNLVSQIDLLPTMLDYANIEYPKPLTGKSIKPIIENSSSEWRDYLVVELADYKKDPTRKGRMVRYKQFKYNLYTSKEEQLFDLKNDPGEIHNLLLSNDYENIRNECRKKIQEWAQATTDSFAINILKP